MGDSMDVRESLKSVQPVLGQVTPIKTVQETQAVEEFGDAYVAEVNLKSASKVIKVLDAAFPRDPSLPLNHLRRFAKHAQLPESLQSTILKREPSAQTIFVLISPPLPETDTLRKLLAPFAPPPSENDSPSSSTEPSQDTGKICLHSIRVPIQPPLNPLQAEKWTKTIWPVVFNPAAQRATIAPPPHILSRTRDLIQPMAGYYLALAQRVADEAAESGRGRGIGAVVVDPEIQVEDANTQWAEAIVAVAGDARYSRREAGAAFESELPLGSGPNSAEQIYNPDLEGGPELHPLMRSVEMIARKRRGDDQDSSTEKSYLSPLESYFLSQSDVPTASSLLDSTDISPVPEKLQKIDEACHAVPRGSDFTPTVPRIRSRAQGGYLCTDLDVYLTHEPCLCCSMGLLLSRFRAVIFPRKGRMVTGGLASEPVVRPVSDPEPLEQGTSETPTTDIPPQEPEGSKSEEKKEESVYYQGNRQYYGIHWRKELNWRALGYEFVEDSDSPETGAKGKEKVAFHA